MSTTKKPSVKESLKYRDLINKSQSQVEQEELDLKEQEAKSHLELSIAQTKLDLANAKKDLAKAQCAVPYNVQAELVALEAVESKKAGLAFAEAILAERF